MQVELSHILQTSSATNPFLLNKLLQLLRQIEIFLLVFSLAGINQVDIY